MEFIHNLFVGWGWGLGWGHPIYEVSRWTPQYSPILFQHVVEVSLLFVWFFFFVVVFLNCRTPIFLNFGPKCRIQTPIFIILGQNVEFSLPFPVENRIRQPCGAYLLTTNIGVMAWFCQVKIHYLNQWWLRSVFPYGITSSQWGNPLTHWGLVTPFGDIDLGQHWLR